MRLCYARCSEPSALEIAAVNGCIRVVHSQRGDINWGREAADTVLNPDISSVTNKRVMRQVFQDHGVPMPALVSISDLRSDLARGVARHVIGRPDKHTKGRGLWHITTNRELDRAVRGTRRKRAATHFMDFVEADREYRVHVFQGKSIRISEKEFFINDEGKKDYTTKKPGDIKLRNVREAAKQAVKAVGMDFGAVDILAQGDNNARVFVLEVNAAPGLGGSMPRVYATAFIKWWEGDWNE